MSRNPPSPPISSLEQNASSEILLIHATFHASISTPVTQLREPIRPKRSIHSVACCGTAPDFPALRQLDEHFSVAFSGQSVLRVENDRDEAEGSNDGSVYQPHIHKRFRWNIGGRLDMWSHRPVDYLKCPTRDNSSEPSGCFR